MKNFFGIHSLRGLIRFIWEELDKKVKIKDIVNNLNTASNVLPLSANMGVELNKKIRNLDSDEDGIVNNSALLEGHPASYFAKDGDAMVTINNLLGEPGGIAPLDPSGQVPSEHLPSYVDDVIEGYLTFIPDDTDPEAQGTPDKFFEDPDHTTMIVPERSKIYVNLDNECSYRWTGSMYIEITSSDMVEMEDDEVRRLWFTIGNEVHNVVGDITFTLTPSIVARVVVTSDKEDAKLVIRFRDRTSETVFCNAAIDIGICDKKVITLPMDITEDDLRKLNGNKKDFEITVIASITNKDAEPLSAITEFALGFSKK